MDKDLRTSLWNLIYTLYEELGHHGYYYWPAVAKHLAFHFFKSPIDDLPDWSRECRNWIRGMYSALSWHEVYDFIEFLVEHHKTMAIGTPWSSGGTMAHPIKKEELITTINVILESELSGFKFTSGVLSTITNETEIKEIESAIETANEKMLQGVQAHLTTALELLGKRPDPDYRNSIKESISAVESVAKLISGEEKAKGLKDPLNELSDKTYIHEALKKGFLSIYGYTSDDEGIRHPILEDTNAGFDEAKFMLVSCSAFVNFLISKADAAGLLDAE